MGKQISRYEHHLGANHTQYDQAMKKSGRATSQFSEKQRALASSTALIDGPLGGVASRISNINTLFRSGNLLLAGSAIGIAGVGFATARAARELSDYEVAQQKINNILEATGFAAGRTAEQIEDLAQAEGFRTLADVTDIRKASAALASYGNITTTIFDRSIKLGNDLAQVYSGSVSNEVKTLAKALDDPAKGLTRLESKYGTIEPEIRRHIVQLAEQGELYKAQDLILQELEGRFSGAGDGEGIAHSFDTLGQSISNAFVSFGDISGLSVALTAFANKTSSILDEETLNKIEDPTLGQLKRLIEFKEAEIGQLQSNLGFAEGQSGQKAEGDRRRFNARIEAARQELLVLTHQVTVREATAKADDKVVEARQKAASLAEFERRQDEALAALAQDVDDQAIESNKKQKKLAKEARREQEQRVRELLRQEKEIDSVRINALDPLEKVNAEFDRTIARLEEIKRLSPSLAGAVDNVIPIASARNVQDQKDTYGRLLGQELNKLGGIDVDDPESADSKDRLLDQYNERRAVIESFAEDEILAEESKLDAMIALNKEYSDQAQKIDQLRWEAGFTIAKGALGNLASLMNSGSKTAFKIGKVAAIASATISGIEAAVHAYKFGAQFGGPALGAAFAATAAAATLVQIQQIRAQQFGGGGTISAGEGGGTPNVYQPVQPTQPSGPQFGVEDTKPNFQIVFNGPVNGLDAEHIAETLRDHLVKTDFLLVTRDSRNGQELVA